MQYFLTLIMNKITILEDEQNFDLFQAKAINIHNYLINLRIKK